MKEYLPRILYLFHCWPHDWAFGKDVAVGISAVPNPDYDSAHWSRYSEGVRDVLGEVIAYAFAKFFFYPSAHGTGGKTHAAGHE